MKRTALAASAMVLSGFFIAALTFAAPGPKPGSRPAASQANENVEVDAPKCVLNSKDSIDKISALILAGKLPKPQEQSGEIKSQVSLIVKSYVSAMLARTGQRAQDENNALCRLIQDPNPKTQSFVSEEFNACQKKIGSFPNLEIGAAPPSRQDSTAPMPRAQLQNAEGVKQGVEGLLGCFADFAYQYPKMEKIIGDTTKKNLDKLTAEIEKCPAMVFMGTDKCPSEAESDAAAEKAWAAAHGKPSSDRGGPNAQAAPTGNQPPSQQTQAGPQDQSTTGAENVTLPGETCEQLAESGAEVVTDDSDDKCGGPPGKGVAWSSGQCHQMALKIVSEANDNASGGGVKGDNEIAVVDYTGCPDVSPYELRFPLNGSHAFHFGTSDDQQSFLLDISQTGGISLKRVDGKPACKGVFGCIGSIFDSAPPPKELLPNGVSITGLTEKRRDMALDPDMSTMVTMTNDSEKCNQDFHAIYQGGPAGCVLLFAAHPSGSDPGVTGVKPDLMACINDYNQNEPNCQNLPPEQAVQCFADSCRSLPQCLGSYQCGGSGAKHMFSIAHTQGSGFDIEEVGKDDPNHTCTPVPAPTPPGGPGTPEQSLTGAQPGPNDNTSGQSGSQQCAFPGPDGKPFDDKSLVKKLDNGYALYAEGLPPGNDYYASFICQGEVGLGFVGIVQDGIEPSADGSEISVTVLNPKYDAGVSPQSLASMSIGSKRLENTGTVQQYILNTKDGKSLIMPNSDPPGEQIYHLPANILTPAKQSQVADQVASSIETVNPGDQSVTSVDVYPRGGDAASAVKKAMGEEHVQKHVDSRIAGAFNADANGALETGLKDIGADDSLEVHFELPEAKGVRAQGFNTYTEAVTDKSTSTNKTKTLVCYQNSNGTISLVANTNTSQDKDTPHWLCGADAP